MISKNALVVALAALPLACGLAHAESPLLPLNSDGSAAIFFVADATVAYNDNIFFQHDKTGDEIFTIAPGFDLVAGGDGSSKFDLLFKEALSAYSDHHDLNNQLANVDAKYTYDAQTAFKLNAAAGFHQTAQATNQTNIVTGDIVQTNTFNASAIGEYQVTEKSSLSSGVNYNGTRYTNFTGEFNNQDSYSIPVTWYYNITDKLDLGLTYSYTNTTIYKDQTNIANGENPGSQEVDFLGLTARGQVTDKFKIEADAGVGYSDLTGRSLGLGGDFNSTTFNFNLTSSYAITEKLSATLSGGRNFGVSALGGQTTTTNGTFGLAYAITEDWSANANVGYMVQQFAGPTSQGGGTDNIFTTGFGVSYQYNKYLKFGVSYAFFNDDSNRTSSFNDNTVSITASVRY